MDSCVTICRINQMENSVSLLSLAPFLSVTFHFQINKYTFTKNLGGNGVRHMDIFWYKIVVFF